MAEIVSTKYESDNGNVYKIRIGADIAAVATNTAPAGAVTDGVGSVKVSKAVLEFGIEPRQLLLFRTVGTSPDTSRKYKVFPILDPAQFTNAAFNIDAALVVGGTTWTVLDKFVERVK